MSLRLFAALPLPDDVAERLLAVMRGVPGAKWRPRENLHLTLRFFGEVAEPVAEEIDSALKTVAARTASFDLTLKGAGAFGKSDPHTLWAGVAPNPALESLAAHCERAARDAGLTPEKRKFSAHVTLASVSATDLARVQAFEQRLALFETRPIRIENFGLYSSHVRRNAPSLYVLEAEYPLSR